LLTADDFSFFQLGDAVMNKTLLVFFLLFASAAFAQSFVGRTINNEPQNYSVESHPAHADYAAMSVGTSILGSGGYGLAQGERPASDFVQGETIPLGTFAREYRKQHAAQQKKSRVVWVNQ
jgi:hypothetical protein